VQVRDEDEDDYRPLRPMAEDPRVVDTKERIADLRR